MMAYEEIELGDDGRCCCETDGGADRIESGPPCGQWAHLTLGLAPNSTRPSLSLTRFPSADASVG